jgi:hypothetical protein
MHGSFTQPASPEPMNYQEAIERLPPMWTIYDRPPDYPNDVVVRVWYGEFAGPRIAEFDVQEFGRDEAIYMARAAIVGQGASFCFGRNKEDDPVIVETWI